MYRPLDKLQHSFFDFNQPLGMHMNPKNRWIDLADQILKVTVESNTFPLKHTMKADICRKPLGDIMNAPGIIRSVCWRIRSAERERTGSSAKDWGFGCRVRSWDGQGRWRDQKRRRNRSIRITGTG